MAVDKRGTLYVCTDLGIQMCDQAGRVQGIISSPPDSHLSNIVFGGSNFDEIYASGNGSIFKRKVKVKGAPACLPPSKPAPPSL